jgi:hypothetical protein
VNRSVTRDPWAGVRVLQGIACCMRPSGEPPITADSISLDRRHSSVSRPIKTLQ